jgi:hypothetical protein
MVVVKWAYRKLRAGWVDRLGTFRNRVYRPPDLPKHPAPPCEHGKRQSAIQTPNACLAWLGSPNGDTLWDVVIRPKTVSVMAFCAIAVAASFYLLSFGVAVLLGAPTRPGQGFLRPEKFFYGFLPVFATPAILAVMLRRWVRLFARRRNAWLSVCAVAVFAVSLDTVVFLELRGRQDERILPDWRRESAVFTWGTGEVKIPAGFTYVREHGIDTFMGRFTSEDRGLTIEHDIGELAGEHGGMGNLETLTEGSRVRFGGATYPDERGDKKYFFKVSFPDASCANFYLESTSEKDAAVIESIARSFHPRGWVPSFLRPLLPEVLRSDCRYRLKLPGRL